MVKEEELENALSELIEKTLLSVGVYLFDVENITLTGLTLCDILMAIIR